MFSDLPCGEEAVSSFVEVLKRDLPDPHDNRGKRHSLVLVVVARAGHAHGTAEALQRPPVHLQPAGLAARFERASERASGFPYPPAALARRPALDGLIERCFGVRIQVRRSRCWVAVDGKTLRGALEGGEKQGLVMAVAHGTGQTVGQARQADSKSSEIPVVRELLGEAGLDGCKVSLWSWSAERLRPPTGKPLLQPRTTSAIK